MTSAWTTQLDRLDNQLRRQRSALQSGVVPDVLDLDQPTEPMTDIERVRAADLMARTDEFLFELLQQSRALRPKPTSPYR